MSTRGDFLDRVRRTRPEVLAANYLAADTIAAFPDANSYANYRQRVSNTISDCETVTIAGTGNWRYSLNPKKDFREFHAGSDIDLCVISAYQFSSLWEELRRAHRDKFYLLPYEDRQRLRRNGENVYSGFISPEWLPDSASATRFSYKKKLNFLSDASVSYRTVKVLFFKNTIEAIDYYARGFIIAQRTLS